MRVLAKVLVDTPAGNAAIKSGALGKVIESTIAMVKPEAAYFTTDSGKRCAYFVFDLKDVSDIPMIAEPWFHELGAAVDFSPVMVAGDVGAGLQKAFPR
jgi:hypothetical protein